MNSSLLSVMIRYRRVPRIIVLLVGAELLLNLVNSSFMLILNIHLRKQGFMDDQIAFFTSFRFLGVLALAFPMGLFIRGRRLKPFFLASAALTPFASLLILFAIQAQSSPWMHAGVFIWGVSIMLSQVCALPFIMRYVPFAARSESISLNFATWSLALILAGLMIAGLTSLEQFRLGGLAFPWDEHHILLALVLLSFLALPLMMRIQEPDPATGRDTGTLLHRHMLDYDWNRILRAVVPTLLIAVGAGLTIPFVNLFFFSVFGIDSATFSLLGSASAVLVLLASLSTPVIRRRVGYYWGILGSQSAAILFLVVMALTELLAPSLPGVVFVAIACFILRQPLMNMAQPMTSEMTMEYIGPRNQELLSALNSSIWSGSWFISAKIFQHLRALQLPYWKIFMLTASLYGAGVVMYWFLIREYHRMRVPVSADPAVRKI
ncbi:MAG: MFS transporter [Calditrichaeota bacterium]|nr:MFS transporter [Calditrichota bacterium]